MLYNSVDGSIHSEITPGIPPGDPRGHPPGLLLKGKHPQDPHEFALEYTGTRPMYSACKAKQDATAEKLRVH